MATLTSAMGVTPPSLYAAFGDKHRLFEEAAELYFRRAIGAVDRAAALPTAYEAVAQMLDDTAHAHTDAATPPGCLMLTEPRLDTQREILHQRLEGSTRPRGTGPRSSGLDEHRPSGVVRPRRHARHVRLRP